MADCPLGRGVDGVRIRSMSSSSTELRLAARAMVETDHLLGLVGVPASGRVSRSTPATTAASESSPAVPGGEVVVEAVPEAAPVSVTQQPAVDPESLGDDVVSRLERIEALHAEECDHCTASTTHQSVVFGDGDPHATVMFVGEAPGAEEDRVGRPFVGRAGELLDRMIDSVGLSRDGVYIGNIVKVRPPENRTPRPDECEACGPWLLSQVAAVRPRVVVALGATPAKYLLRTSTGITRLRGRRVDVEVGGFDVPVVPTFHPAYVLRQYTPEVRRAVWEDLKLAASIAGGT